MCIRDSCKTGEAVITPAFNLTCKNIIHTVGPVWNNGTDNEENHLENCYNNCLKIASDNHLESIASVSYTHLDVYKRQVRWQIHFK